MPTIHVLLLVEGTSHLRHVNNESYYYYYLLRFLQGVIQSFSCEKEWTVLGSLHSGPWEFLGSLFIHLTASSVMFDVINSGSNVTLSEDAYFQH